MFCRHIRKYYLKMKILLTGASGFLGKHIYSHFLALNDQVDTLGRGENNEVFADLTQDILPIKEDYDIVVHCAGKAHSIPRNDEERRAFFEVNLEGTKKLITALELNPPKSFVLISTIAVYGLEKGKNISESCPLNTKEPYGLSKKMAEELVVEWCKKNNCKCTIFRLPLVIGLGAPGNFLSMINGIRSGKYLRIGNGSGVRSMVLATDVAKIIKTAANVGGTFNLSDGEMITFAMIEDILSLNFKKKIKNLPRYLAKPLAFFGDVVNKSLRKKLFPFDSNVFEKMTSYYTIDDSHAREKLNWNPNSVLQFIKENIY